MGLAGGYRGNGKRRNGRLAFRRDRLLPAERRRLSGFVGFCGCCGCYRQAQGIPHAKFQFLLSACAIGEPPFTCLGNIGSLPEQASGSHGVYAEGRGFCLSAEQPEFLFVAWGWTGNRSTYYVGLDASFRFFPYRQVSAENGDFR